MRELGPSSNAEMVFAFVKAEIHVKSCRRPEYLEILNELNQTEEDLIQNADLTSTEQNDLRSKTLLKKRPALFVGFPKDVAWKRFEIERGDFPKMMYIARETTWDMLSSGTR